MSIETEPIAEELIASEASASARKKNRGSQTEGRTCLEDQEGRGSATAVITDAGATARSLCRYCGSDNIGSVVQEEAGTRAAAPASKQRYGLAARNPKAVRTRKVKTVVAGGVEIDLRAGPRDGPGPSRVFSLMKRTSSLSGMNQRRPSACSCAFQSSGRSTRRMRLKTVRSGGWWPSAIASMILGEKKPSRSNRRTERLSRCSRRAISSTELTCPEIQLERPSACAGDRLEQRQLDPARCGFARQHHARFDSAPFQLQRNQPGESEVARCAVAVFLCDWQLK